MRNDTNTIKESWFKWKRGDPLLLFY
jgi:hypothetical protein